MSTPTRKPILLAAVLGASLFSPGARAAKDCDSVFNSYNAQIDDLKNAREQADDADKSSYTSRISSLIDSQYSAKRQCQNDNKTEQEKQDKLAKAQSECDAKRAQYPDVYAWDANKKKCLNKAEQAYSKSVPGSDDCASASVFAGDLKGQNCKKAMDTVRDVKARNGALTDATTAATAAYGNLQASGATGQQNDAQTRQANIMKMLAFSKMATGALNLSGAMQLKSAAAGAEDANSTITGAQKDIQNACANADDDQACFYQNAAKYGITPDQRNYASFARMKQGAQQSQDQADQANALAKSSMLTGAADMLVGLQALKAAQMANNNAGQLAPPPMMVAPPPAQRVALGGDSAGPAAPSLAPAAPGQLQDLGNPNNDAATFGPQHHSRIEGSMAPTHMGAANIFKSATSGVSGGGGGGGIGGGAGPRGMPPRPRTGPRNSVAGEYNLAGGGGGGKGGPVGDKAEANNPLADMLAKLFPQGQDGKPVVDTRQIASAAGGTVVEEDQQGDAGVTATDLSIFEQISAKYRQLNNSGRF